MTTLVDKIKLEIETSTVVNPIDNHSGADGTNGWQMVRGAPPYPTTVPFANFTSSTAAVPNAEDGYTLRVDAAGASPANRRTIESAPIPVEVGTKVALALTAYAAASGPVVNVELTFVDSNGKEVAGYGAFLGGVTATPAAAVYSTAWTTVPAGAVSAVFILRVALGIVHLSRISVGVSTAGSPSPHTWTAPTYTNIIGTTNRIVTERGNDLDGVTDRVKASMISARIIDPAVDPATNANMRPGRRVRVLALRGTEWKRLGSGKVDTLDVDYTKEGQTVVELLATDSGAPLNSRKSSGWYVSFDVSGGNSVADVSPVEALNRVLAPNAIRSDTLEVVEATAGVNHIGKAVSLDDNATLADWCSRFGLTYGYYVWLSASNTVKLRTPAQLGTAPVVVFSDSHADAGAVFYTGIGIGFGSKALVNQLTVQRINLDEDGDDGVPGSKIYGPYTASASESEWGPQQAEAVILDGSPSAIASDLLDVFATPVRMPREIRFDALQHIDAAIDLDLYQVATVKRTGILNAPFRLLKIRHEILAGQTASDERWGTTVDFRPLETATPVVVTNPPTGADTGPGDIALGGFPRLASRRRDTSQGAMPNGSWIDQICDDVVTDEGITYDTATHEYTVPKNGRYLIAGSCRIDGAAATYRNYRVTKDTGSGHQHIMRTFVYSAVSGVPSIAITERLTAGTKVRFQARVDVASMTLVADGTYFDQSQTIAYIGP